MLMPGPFDTQAAAILDFYRHLSPRFALGDGIAIMNPFKVPATWQLASQFYEKFYSDIQPRVFIFGINPGRHGAGITGVPFTDPLLLEKECGIPNDMKKKTELSGEFIYRMIHAYGGVKTFYSRFFFTSLSPLGFVRHGKNLNYYDDKQLIKDFEPFMLKCIRTQLDTMPTLTTCYCLGEGTNYKYFSRINAQHGFFKEIIPLPHPRWVMQYRRPRIAEFVDLYLSRLATVG